MQTYGEPLYSGRGGFWLIVLDKEGNERTCNYWYLLQTSACVSHTAFRTRHALVRWFNERGLPVPENLPEPGEHHVLHVPGKYRKTYCDMETLTRVNGESIKVLDNAEYTLGKVTTDADGLRTVYVPNCNHRDRVKFDYWATQRELDGEI